MLEEAGGLRCHLPLGFGQGAPSGDIAADFVDNRGGVVLLFFGGKAFPFVEDDNLLHRGVFVLFSLGNGCEKVRASTFFEDALGRLTLSI